MNPDLILGFVFTESHPSSLEEDQIFKNVTKICKFVSPSFLKSLQLEVMVVGDDEMISINRTRRGIDKTTDVLSFPLFQAELPLPNQILGEVVISIDTCERQAREIGHSFLDEFYRLLVHGILHLFGYDHETNDSDAKEMMQLEDRCLELVFN